MTENEHDEDEAPPDECAGGEDDESSHDCGWTNDECPEGCTTDHEVDRCEAIRCPETMTWWTYCDRCTWEAQGSRWEPEAPTYIGGEYLCDPYEHGYCRCGGCEQWVDEYDGMYSESDECTYCSSCYDDRGSRDCGRGRQEGERDTPCHSCNTPHVHVNLWTERFLCDCKATHNMNLDIPVALAEGHAARLVAVLRLAA